MALSGRPTRRSNKYGLRARTTTLATRTLSVVWLNYFALLAHHTHTHTHIRQPALQLVGWSVVGLTLSSLPRPAWPTHALAKRLNNRRALIAFSAKRICLFLLGPESSYTGGGG